MSRKDKKQSTIKKMSKKKVDLGDVEFNLVDLEPIISGQKKDQAGRGLGEMHLPDLTALKNRK